MGKKTNTNKNINKTNKPKTRYSKNIESKDDKEKKRVQEIPSSKTSKMIKSKYK